jgi:glycosyltransferase involved in cell wall biosynthesis
VPGYDGQVITVHCRSRFKASDAAASDGEDNPNLLRSAQRQEPRYVFVAAADDPRKNPEMAIRLAKEFHALGLRVVLGGGLSEATRKRLRNLFPDQFLLADPVFLPRLRDEDLAEVYRHAALVLVCSRDEGFSLPIAESVALRRPVVASRIPAHNEQILDPQLLFDLDDVDGLWRAVRAGLALGRAPAQLQTAYRRIDYVREQEALRALVVFGKRHAHASSPARQRPIIVGPSFEKPTGIAMFNRLMVAQCRTRDADFEYVDVDDLPSGEFHDWLLTNAMRDIIYVMGNNNVFHKNCFIALQNVPGHCILHDSRLFEFILNQDGPFRIVQMWGQRYPLRPIDVAKVVEWQQERKLLRHSFLEHVTTRVRTILVHNQVLCRHIADQYSFTRVHYLPFALQMTDEEVRFVLVARAKCPRRDETQPLLIVMLGETEPTKGCAEIIYAVKILRLQGVPAVLSFIGKSEDPYHTELVDATGRLGLSDQVSFTRYVPRQHYLEALATADVVVQLRYSLFGQVSGPLADAVACGVPAVATEELANGMGLVEACECVPNVFSPLHIAGAVRRAVGRSAIAPKSNSMDEYVDGLFAVCGLKRISRDADESAATTGTMG